MYQYVLAAPPEQYDFLPFDQALKQSAQDNKPLFLYFGRYGCNTCRKMHKEVFSNPALRQSLSEQFVLAYVDTESGNRILLPNGERTTEMQFASRNRIIGTPTFIYFSEDQKPLFTKAGFQTISQMQQYNDFVSQGHYKTTALKQYLSNQ
jgi:thioredoxin-related protein